MVAVVIPIAMGARAVIARPPLQVGPYTALVPMLVFVLLGCSQTLTMSTMSTIAILIGGSARRANRTTGLP